MADIEKTIKGLDTCIKHIDQECPTDCPYYEKCTKYEGRVVFQPLLRDTLTLLKEQKAEIQQLRLLLDKAKGTCKDIHMPDDTVKSAIDSLDRIWWRSIV